MRGLRQWLRDNDRLGGSVKGAVLILCGVVAVIVSGPTWLAVGAILAGLALIAIVVVPARREQERLNRWRSRRP